MTTRDIQGHLQEIYGIDVSLSLISQVTDAISEEVLLWQNRPLDEVYPIVYLDAFTNKWDSSHPSIAKSWRNNWERIIPQFSFPVDIRKAIYTTNAIESLNMSLRKVTKNRGHFPNDEAMFKLLYLAFKNLERLFYKNHVVRRIFFCKTENIG